MKDRDLKVIDVGNTIKAPKVGSIIRLTDKSNGRWKARASLFYKTTDLNVYFRSNQNSGKDIKPYIYIYS